MTYAFKGAMMKPVSENNKRKSMNKIVLSEGTLQRVSGGESWYGGLKGMGLGDALVKD